MGGYWFLSSFVPIVTSMSVEADVEGVLGFSHVLLLASMEHGTEKVRCCTHTLGVRFIP